MKFDFILCVFSLLYAVLGQSSIALNRLKGVILIFETDNEITDDILQLKTMYKNYVQEELENSIGFDYDTLFVGFSIKFTDLAAIYYKVTDYLKNKHVEEIDDQVIYDGLIDMLLNFKAKELQALGVTLNILPDAEVGIYNEEKLT